MATARSAKTTTDETPDVVGHESGVTSDEAVQPTIAEAAQKKPVRDLADPNRRLTAAEKQSLARLLVQISREFASSFDSFDKGAESEALADVTPEQASAQVETHMRYLFPKAV